MASRGFWLGLAGIGCLLALWMVLPAGALAGAADWMIRAQRAYLTEMRGAVRALRGGDAAALATLLAGAFTYGVLHAIGPGHGKAVIASYVLADRASLRRGLIVTAISSLAQGVSAVALVGVLAALLGLGRGRVEFGAWMIEVGATGLLVAFGLFQAFRAATGGHRQHHHDHHEIHRHSSDLHHDHATCAHAPAPPPPTERRSMLAVALGVGIRPCSGAIVLLLFALVQGVFLAGIAGTFAMAAGTGVTVAVLAAGAVYARRLVGQVAEASDRAAGIQRALAVLGWLGVAGFAALLLAGVWQGPGGLF